MMIIVRKYYDRRLAQYWSLTVRWYKRFFETDLAILYRKVEFAIFAKINATCKDGAIYFAKMNDVHIHVFTVGTTFGDYGWNDYEQY